MGFLSRDQILAAQHRRTMSVAAPELGGDLRLREPSAAATLRCTKLLEGGEGADGAKRELMIEAIKSTVVDDKGELLFPTDDDAEKFFDTVSLATATAVTSAFVKLAFPEKTKAVEAAQAAAAAGGEPEGKSEASSS